MDGIRISSSGKYKGELDDPQIKIENDSNYEEFTSTAPVPKVKQETDLFTEENQDFIETCKVTDYNENKYEVKSENEDDELDEREFLTDNEYLNDSEPEYEHEDLHFLCAMKTEEISIAEGNLEDDFIRKEQCRLHLKTYNELIIRFCQFCGIKFSTELAWKTHLNTEHDFNKQFSIAFKLTNESKLQCKICKIVLQCETTIEREEHFLRHQLYPDFIKCKLCENFQCNTTLAIKDHIDKEHSTVFEEITIKKACIYCGKVFRTVPQLLRHYLECHKELDSENVVFVCPSCGEEFSKEQIWKEHCVKELNVNKACNLFIDLVDDSGNVKDNKLQCLKCFEIIENTNLLLKHASTHKMPHKIHKCRHCREQFDDEHKIPEHACTQLVNYTKMVNMQKEHNSPNLLHVCPVCGEEFDHHAAWYAHLIAEHELDKQEKMNIITIPGTGQGIKPVKCSICEQTWTKFNRALQMVHAFSHMPFKIKKCKICKYEYSGSRFSQCYCKLKPKPRYKLAIGPIDNCTLQCTKCGALFQDGNQLNNHLCTEHNIRRLVDLNFKLVEKGQFFNTYECTKCQPSFQAKTFKSLFLHAIKHDKFRLYLCNNCNNSFDTLSAFRLHKCENSTLSYKSIFRKYIMRLCPACGQRNASVEMFKEHIKTYHDFNNLKNLNIVKVPKSKPTKYKCTTCEHVFETKLMHLLQNHAFSHMPFKLYTCAECHEGFDAQPEIFNHLKEMHNVNISKFHGRYASKAVYTFHCPVCNVELKSEIAFTDHINTVHKFNTLEGMALKKVIVYDSKILKDNEKYECLDCGATLNYKSYDRRLEHRFLHLPYKPYKCQICNRRYSRKNSIYMHLRICKTKKENEIENMEISLLHQQPTTSSTAVSTEWDIDDECINSREYLADEQHLSSCKRNIAEKVDVDNSVRSKSFEMDTTTSSSAGIIFHCPVCNIELKSETEFTKHLDIEHKLNTLHGLALKTVVVSCDLQEFDVKNIYECLDCGTIVKNRPCDRLEHRISHLPHKPYKCYKCNRRYARKNTAYVHIRNCKRTSVEDININVIERTGAP